jgi:hypothetical protein
VPENYNELVPIARFRAPDGALVAEVDLTRGHRHSIDELIARARGLGADKLWVHAHVIDAGFGFERRGSYVRLEAVRPPTYLELPSPPTERIREIQRACFGDVWGHHDPGPPDPASVFVGLNEIGTWVGICEVDPEAQWIGGPGVVPFLRTPDRFARLVRGAAAHLRNEPVVLETWGDTTVALDSYASLGFEVVHSVSGWELNLKGR